MLFYSVVLGSIGPVLAFTVPPIRERLGYRPPELIPTTYPSASPHLGFFFWKALTFVCWWQFRSGQEDRCRVMRMKSEAFRGASATAS